MSKAKYVFVMLSLWVAGSATADIQDGLDSMFLTTGNEPTIYQSQRRLGLDFGTLRLRAPVNNYAVVNLTPPTVRSGCGGIDMYGGSFTFINAEQFRQMLRQIGANALGYAFKLALKSMCDSCDSIMTGLQDTVNKLNKMQVDTCKWAKGFVNDFTEAYPETFNEEYKSEETTAGNFADSFEGVVDLFTNPGQAASGGDPSGADPGRRDQVGNMTWNAVFVTDAGAAFTFVPGNLSHNELLMNIAGTYIYGETDTTEQNPDIAPRLLYEELKTGKRKIEDGSDDAKPLLRCNADPSDMCMQPVPVPSWSFEGVNTWVETTLQTAADHMANPATAGTDHPLPLQDFLATLPLTVTRHMMVLQGDQQALNHYVQNTKEYVGSVYAATLALSMADMIRVAYENQDTPRIPPNVVSYLQTFEADAKADKKAVEERYSEMWLKTEELVAALTQGYNQPGNLIRTNRD